MEDGYYPKSDENNIDSYINCYKNPEGYYLKNQVYEQCYPTCKYCSELGNEADNKCTECKSTHEIKNDFDDDKNCYEKCNYKYYYDSDNKYQCTTEDKCPDNYNKLVENKKRCIDECKNDNIYKYEYQNKCYENCPSGTHKNNNTYFCEQIIEDKEECILKEEKLILNDEISINYAESITQYYVDQYGFSNDYVFKQENKIYKIYTYKNSTCLNITANEAPQMDFGNCYEKVKSHYGIKEDLIITIIIINEKENSKPSKQFYFSDPSNGKILNISEICFDDKIVIQEDIKTLIEKLDDQKEEFIIYLTNQGIDVFNLSHEFYNDLCFDFDSPNGKDVPMKDRMIAFYPNITLCDDGCENKGVDLETLKAKCECIFGNLMNNDLMDNLYGQAIAEVMDIISSLNIGVMQCFKDIFNKKQFKKCIGGFFILGLLGGQIGCLINFIITGLFNIRRYIFSLSESYKAYIQKNNVINSPPKLQKNKTMKVKSHKQFSNNSVLSSKNTININNNNIRKSVRDHLIGNNNNSKYGNISKLNKNKNKYSLNEKDNSIRADKFKSKTLKPSKFKNCHIKTDKNSTDTKKDINLIKDLLSDSFDDTDFDDVLSIDKRTFCQYFSEKFKNNQIFINTFFIYEILRPRALKFLILIMTIELYFVINALFYNEEYLSELFNSKEKDSFFSFVPRRFNQFVYTSAVSGIISYLIGYFFVEEEKLKRIFIRNKGDHLKMEYELSVLVKDIQSRFIGLIFLSLFLSIISFLYISCFNIVYPYIRTEWIKSSIFILVLMQFINLAITFIHCSIRYIALSCNSEKLFKLSIWFA